MLCLGTVFSCLKTSFVEAYTATNAPNTENGGTEIGNIFSGGRFDRNNLNALAQAADFSDLNAMIEYAKDDTQPNKNSTDFGQTTVEFGDYIYKGKSYTLKWIPVYLSKDTLNNPILTLWLAGTEKENGTVSNQELCSFSGGGMSNIAQTNPSSNNYGTSKIRVEALNNGGTYYSGYNNNITQSKNNGLTATDYTPTSNGTNKYEIFTTGALKDYIVTPENVIWQKDSNRQKNDPKWTVSAGAGNYSQSDWLSDKLWLPSLYEVFDNKIGNQSQQFKDFNENGGLWQTGDATNQQKRSNSTWTWLRSGYPDCYNCAFSLSDTGGYNVYYVVSSAGAVRPALHLNLTKAAENSFNTIKNIYDQETNKFNGDNLNELAKIAQFADVNAMADYAKDGTQANKTAQDFGDTVVEFGTYTYGGKTFPLKWIPVYLSQDTDKNPILTLWLAGTSGSNDVSAQEVSTYSDGTQNDDSKSFNGADVYCNTYDGSYIRNYILNGGQTYAGNFGTNSTISKPASDTLTKFTQFTAGALKDYIVTPQNVDWQANASYLKNDAKWDASGNTTDASGNKETSYTIMGANGNYPSGWLTDKLWLPSIYETFDSTISADGTRRWDFSDNGGLWKTSVNKRSNLAYSWLRSATTNVFHTEYILTSTGGYDTALVDDPEAVRPALHLNLNKAAENAGITHIHNWSEWTVDIPSTCTTYGTEVRTCSGVGTCPLGGKETRKSTTLDPDNHTYPAEKTVTTQPTCVDSGQKMFVCTECGYKNLSTAETIDPLGHDYKEEVIKIATCAEKGKLKKTCQHDSCPEETKVVYEDIPLADHKYVEVVTAPTCHSVGITTCTCSVCKDSYTKDEKPKLAHKWIEPIWRWADDLETCDVEFRCELCKDTEIVHANVEKHATTATCGAAGEIKYTAKVKAADGAEELTDTRTKHVDKLPHETDSEPTSVTTEPTCTTEGLGNFTCKNCGQTYTAKIPALGHLFGELVPAVAADCENAGNVAYKHCSRCNLNFDESGNKIDQVVVPAKGHTWSAWTITKPATKDETGEKQRTCSACQKTETQIIAKLVEDEGGNGSVGDLPELPDPDSNYKLEITIKATDRVYEDLAGRNKGYKVGLWIVNNKTDDKKEFNKEMEVTLSLIVPHGMEEFTLYKLVEGGYEEIKPENYTVEAGVLSIRTTLPEEFIFNTAAAPAKGGIPWWVWLIVGLAVVAVVIIIVIVVVKKKHAPAPETETVYVNGESYDDTELKRKVEEQNEKIDELLNREIPVDALSQTLTDDEMRSFFTDQELQSMVQQGKITQEDYDRVIRGRKR